MSSHIKALLDELYELEPNLQNHENQIIEIIKKMQENHPQIVMDEQFKDELRRKVLAELRTAESSKKSINWGWIIAAFSTVGFAAFAFYTFIGGFSYQAISTSDGGKKIQSATTHMLSFAPNITKLANNAYGNAISLAVNNASSQIGNRETISAIAPTASRVGGATQDAKMMATDSMMPPMDYPYYRYTYTGTLSIPRGDFVVYKRNISGFSPSETTTFLSQLEFSGLSLSALENKNLTSLSFVEDRDFGYSVNLDFQNGNISFYQNWTRWPQAKCDANGCEQSPKITKNDIPPDDELIKIGDDFLTKYQIDRSLYGVPKIDSSWKIMYARAIQDNNSEEYIPEQFTLTYPLLLDGKTLYEEYGGYKGLSLTIDIRTKKVTSMYGFEKQNLSSSAYTTATPLGDIEKMIQYGGRYESKPYEGQKVVELALGEPILQYVHVYSEWKEGKADEYYVPAYVFPVQDKPQNFTQEQIIIPVVADFAKFVSLDSSAPVGTPIPITLEKSSR